MSYKKYLQQRIQELQREISEDKGEIEGLKKELTKLQLAEFEEDLHDQGDQQLLKGQCCFNTTPCLTGSSTCVRIAL